MNAAAKAIGELLNAKIAVGVRSKYKSRIGMRTVRCKEDLGLTGLPIGST
jgi:hypothetical protein